MSLRFILGRRTLVGTISCMTLYYSARIASDVQTGCKFYHILFHGVFGYKVAIFISFLPLQACAILNSVWYMCVQSCTAVSCDIPCRICVMSTAYTWKYTNLPRTLLLCGGFCFSPVSCHFRSHSPVIFPAFFCNSRALFPLTIYVYLYIGTITFSHVLEWLCPHEGREYGEAIF